uniref:ISXO2-like transposase domain-containing protein n=1 Tax=Octopus bimaculoides TaxID=37653 RepID=A0A0L8FJ23_OCTBM
MVDKFWKKGYMQQITDRKAETLEVAIIENVEPGTTIFTDMWPSYQNLQKLGYIHGTMNHSRNFVDPVSGLCTNSVEAFLSRIKRRLKYESGSCGNMEWSHIDEAMHRDYYNMKYKNLRENFQTFIKHTAINPTILNSALIVAKNHSHLTIKEIKVILEGRKSVISFDNKLWVQTDSPNCFDITMGAPDSAQITDLVGIYLLSYMCQPLTIKHLHGVIPKGKRHGRTTLVDADANANNILKHLSGKFVSNTGPNDPMGRRCKPNKHPRTKEMFESLTSKPLQQPDVDSDNDSKTSAIMPTNTVRGHKYDFLKKIMKKCNSTDIGDLIRFCKTTNRVKYQNEWNNIYRNTPNLQTIIQAAATETNIETLATPI